MYLGLGMSSEGWSTREHYPHPYAHEIQHFKYLKSQILPVKEQLYSPLDQVSCDWIDTEVTLLTLITPLQSRDIHSYDNNPLTL